MVLVNWEFLRKGQMDNEKIEEAIARLILAHCADETAHLGVGESLQSHKASQIIDHLAASIVTDKIGDRQIADNSLLRDRFVIAPNFESLDGFFISATGTGAQIIPKGGGCYMEPGSVLGDYCYIDIESLLDDVSYLYDPDFQLVFSLLDVAGEHEDYNDVDICMGAGYDNISGESIGFIWKGASKKFYAYYRIGATVTEFEITPFYPTYKNDIRVEVRDQGDTLNFYYHDVLVKQWTSVGFELSSIILFMITVTNVHNGVNHPFRFQNFIWSQSNYPVS